MDLLHNDIKPSNIMVRTLTVNHQNPYYELYLIDLDSIGEVEDL